MAMQHHWLAGVALAVMVPATCLAQQATSQAQPVSAIPASRGDRIVQQLAEGWRFRKGDQAAEGISFDDATWDTVTVPHTWNRVGAYEPEAKVGIAGRVVDKYQGVGWYRLTFKAPVPGKGQRAWLEFDAASRTAQVWLNGVRLGSHDGGFSRFRFDATRALRSDGVNVLAVKVDNSDPQPGRPTADTLPLAGDFFVQGGLYRPVRLIRTGDVHFAMDDLGAGGVYAQTDRIEADRADIGVVSKLSNQRGATAKGTVVTRLIGREGGVAAEVTQPVVMSASGAIEVAQTLTVLRPHLWQGVKDPYLYELVSELHDDRGRVLDRQAQPFGIRQFRIDPDKGFFINGEHVALHGVGLHQDAMASGWAMSAADIAEQVATIRDMGANTIRLTHYQHGQPVHDLADRLGLVLWDEIGLVTAWTLDQAQGPAPEAIASQARQQLQELIRQNYNHASVAVWGLANEVDFGPSRPDFLGRGIKSAPSDPTPLIQDLARLAAQEDPTRPATLATCCEERSMPAVPIVAAATPVSAANRYFGWYYSEPRAVGEHFDLLHAKRPRQPQAISEYGAGGALSIHTDNPLGGPIDMGGRNQPEEFQSWLHEQTLPVLAQRPFIWASWLWNSFDFATVTRKEGDTQDINTKGLVSYDGKIRKDAYYYYRAMWSPAPTVHLTGRRYVDRAYPVVDVRAYSNAPETELTLNGRSLGVLRNCPNRTCVWPAVRLDPGANHIEATGTFAGGQSRDNLFWMLDASRAETYRIDAGALIAAKAGGEHFGSDNFFAGGTSASADSFPRGRAPVLAAILAGDRRDLLASFREGRFSYRIPVRPGRYMVTLEFVEPDEVTGARRFDVLANGTKALVAFDVVKAAGGRLRPVVRRFAVNVISETLEIDFVPIEGKAIVSAITVEPDRARR